MPSGKSSKESAVLFFYQNLIDLHTDTIEAHVVHEKELKTDDIQWLLGPGDTNSPRSVGISPAYSQSGGLPALACAHDTRVLMINFHSTKAYRDGNTSGSGTQPRNVERRNLLEEHLLCNTLHTLYAFDLAPLALSLNLHLHLRLTEAIDIQSALRVPDRSILGAVRLVIADTSPIFADNITSTFEKMLYESNKHKDLTDPVQRAWLCSFIGRYDFGGIQDQFYKAPRVNMNKFSVEVSLLFSVRLRSAAHCII
jgi:hypothetical protein